MRDRCLRYAIRNGETYGIWGGTTEHQRGPLLRAAHRH
ncbi:WhiB family transcriptional regulator [Planotetraspora kaengkrachanensis]